MAAETAAAVVSAIPMFLCVHHRTEYLYSTPVKESSNQLRLTPPTTAKQKPFNNFISVLPASRLKHYIDLNLNKVHYFDVPRAHKRLLIDSYLKVETMPSINLSNLPYGFTHAQLDQCATQENLYPYLQSSYFVELTPEAWRMGIDIQADSTDVLHTCREITEYIFNEFTYEAGSTHVGTHALEVLRSKTGVCQDFAHAMIAICRSLKIPARYVSGYFYDATLDKHMRGAQASHAWVEVYILGYGWLGLDPTNNKLVDDSYIVLAYGRDYKEAAPVIGTYYGRGHSALLIEVKVEPN